MLDYYYYYFLEDKNNSYLCQCVKEFGIEWVLKGVEGCASGSSSLQPADPVFGAPLSKNLTHLTQIFDQTSFLLGKSSTYKLKIVCQLEKNFDT